MSDISLYIQISKMAAVAILDIWKVQFLTAGMLEGVNVRHRANIVSTLHAFNEDNGIQLRGFH